MPRFEVITEQIYTTTYTVDAPDALSAEVIVYNHRHFQELRASGRILDTGLPMYARDNNVYHATVTEDVPDDDAA